MSTITRFVLLRHEVPEGYARPSHWDLLLERDGGAWTWALEVLPTGWPLEKPNGEVEGLRLADHRLHYFDYEGPVSGERGSVARVLAGSCEWLEAGSDRIIVRLTSGTGTAQLTLEGTGGSSTWQLRFTPA